MEKISFLPGDIILFDGVYACGSDTCERQVWGTAGRRLPRPACGHHGEWRLVRRRVDNYW